MSTSAIRRAAIKLQIIHSVNGDGSETAKNHKKALLVINIDIQGMLILWLIVPFYDFCGF